MTKTLAEEKALKKAQFVLEGHMGDPRCLPEVIETYLAHAPDYKSMSAKLAEALNIFKKCAYPVAYEINNRGHNWSEVYLDQALDIATPVLKEYLAMEGKEQNE